MAKLHMPQLPEYMEEKLGKAVNASSAAGSILFRYLLIAGRWGLNHLARINLEPLYRVCARWIVYIVYDVRFLGQEKLPIKGPAILICNHISYVDGLVINAAMRHPVRYIIDRDIYSLPGVNYFMRLNRGIPIAATRDDVTNALNMISDGLKNGDIICIFPEGQMTYTGNLGRFRPGIEWILQRDPVPVYPLALKGLWGSIFSRKYRKAQHRFFPRSFRRKVDLICGEPLSPEEVKVDLLQKLVTELRHSV
ncbi:MAG: transporter [Rickettsiales bacterium]|jgi:1-acyl-sn-glycerol-3-phosphate acyltransferase|nr:transporter [Rickettsiales bacterium]